jgi:hypothetical protein
MTIKTLTGVYLGKVGGYNGLAKNGSAGGSGYSYGGPLANLGTITGGAGGKGGKSDFIIYGDYGGGGGEGGAGVALIMPASLTNTGTINGGAGGMGGYGGDGGYGGLGGGGVTLATGASLRNSGRITGGAGGLGGTGVYRGGAGGEGGAGVTIASGATVLNSGLITGGAGGGGGHDNSGVDGGGGMGGAGVVLVSGANLINTGTIIGGGGGGGGDTVYGKPGIYYGTGAAAVYQNDPGAVTVTNSGAIIGSDSNPEFTYALQFSSPADRLIVEAGATFTGTVMGAGATLELGGQKGAGTLTGFGGQFNGFGDVTVDAGASWTLEGDGAGRIYNTGTIGLASSSKSTSLVIDTRGDTLTSGGQVILGGGADLIIGASAAVTLTNVDNTIMGGGALGGGKLGLVNEASGCIDGDTPGSLVIDTGANTVLNAGTILASEGAVTIRGALVNSGILGADGGILYLGGAVSGKGSVQIIGGILNALSTFTQSVRFSGKGRLVLAKSAAYAGRIFDFSRSGATTLDLRDIAFGAKTKATWSGDATEVLTVTDGIHTAKLKLAGDYAGTTFTVSSDGHGGTFVVDRTNKAATHAGVRPMPFISAMAGLSAGSAADATPTLEARALSFPTLTAPARL